MLPGGGIPRPMAKGHGWEGKEGSGGRRPDAFIWDQKKCCFLWALAKICNEQVDNILLPLENEIYDRKHEDGCS